MPATFKNGQFEINDDGDLVFLDANDNTILTWDQSTGEWQFPTGTPVNIPGLVDYAGLNDQGVVLSSQIPDLAITETYVVADQAERLSLDVQEGDIAIQTDESQAYIFTGGDSTDNANWSAIVSPPAPVDSVFSRTGDVTAQSGDYSYSQIAGTHGNEDHSETFAVDGDPQPPEDHGNEAHTTAYAADPHGNEAHDAAYSTTEPGDVTSTNWGDYEIQKNGTDGTGILNFKTN
jgi:hypothetical protein